MRRLVDPRDRRRPGLGHPDREDAGAAAVLAVGGDEDKAVVLDARGFPFAPVPDPDAAACANSASADSISARAGRSSWRSMKSGVNARWPSSSPTRLLWSYHSYSRVPRATGASGFVQLMRRWYTGKRRNIPPGPSSREIRRSADPRAGERVRDLEPARPAADDDHVVVAGREGALVYPDHVLAARSRRASVAACDTRRSDGSGAAA